MLPPTFANKRSFRASFVRGLSDMLICQELGVFILVLANASYDPEIQRFLHRKLKRRFDEIARQYRDALRGGRPLHGATADVLVFLKLTAMGYEALRMTEFREAGPWEIQFNHLRAFRPPRMSKAVVTDVYQRYDESAFNFNQPFLRKEVFWEGVLCGRSARLLYNKFPFAELHGLLVVDPLDKRPQFLTAELHRYIWNVAERLGNGMPGIGFGFNAYGAFSSVNHLHFQMYIRDDSFRQGGLYPIEQAAWAHNGGTAPYPLGVVRFDQQQSAMECLESLHAQRCAYNLLYRPGCVYITPRAMQGSYRHANWTGGFAWSETAGAVTTFSGEDFAALTDAAIRREFAKLALPG